VGDEVRSLERTCSLNLEGINEDHRPRKGNYSRMGERIGKELHLHRHGRRKIRS
jgi:hypothetical protein